jgi:hypothetical protein
LEDFDVLPFFSLPIFILQPSIAITGFPAARLNVLRENGVDPADLVVSESEVTTGFPDSILAKDEEATAELKTHTPKPAQSPPRLASQCA